jgi:hypothetical protein
MNAVALVLVIACAAVGWLLLGILGLFLGLIVGLLLAGAVRV